MLFKLKPFEILNIVDEYDGTKTAYFKAYKFYMTDANTENIASMENFYNFNPTEISDIELKIFEILEQNGWF
jgi:hypothetical protein